ncbi:MAG: aminopeptidase, partial [Bacteroidetes bacterium]|nr:aminopeptidase [Bacteroidota bacterium]
MKKLLIILPLLILLSCNQDLKNPKDAVIAAPISSIDPHSFSEPALAKVTHLDLKLNVNFDQKKLNGEATWTIQQNGDPGEIIFDTNGLNIEKVLLDDETKNA